MRFRPPVRALPTSCAAAPEDRDKGNTRACARAGRPFCCHDSGSAREGACWQHDSRQRWATEHLCKETPVHRAAQRGATWQRWPPGAQALRRIIGGGGPAPWPWPP